ncbi:MAG: trypsin-like peptidase domain-containing protein [Rhodospirillales bacterium]|nr:trypsin-like peptidase domain-containing protein [Rhodospirillales bacterium]
MAGEQEAIAAVIDLDGSFLGTGFFSRGVLVTCAHVIDNRERVQAQFGTEKGRRTIAFRLLKVFPPRQSRLCDEPHALCDIAVLRPDERLNIALPDTEIAAGSACGGEVAMRGHVLDPRSGRILVPVRATIDAHPQPNGWRIATPLDRVADAPSGGMSGAPVFHDHITGAIGMLSMGEEDGRGLWLVIPAEALREALADALGDHKADSTGPKFALREIHASTYSSYAHGELFAPRQKARPGEGVEVLFDVSFGCSPDEDFPQLREVDIAITLPPSCCAADVIGLKAPHKTEMDVTIRWRGRLSEPRWRLSVAENNQSLHGRNAALDGPPLFRMPEAEAGQRFRFRMMAYANKAYFVAEDLPGPYAQRSKALSMAASKIINRLQLMEINRPNKDGAIVFCESEAEVVKVEQ